jgi:hypothetical protein
VIKSLGTVAIGNVHHKRWTLEITFVIWFVWVTIATRSKKCVLFGPGKGSRKVLPLEIPAQDFIGTPNALSNNNFCQELA